MPWIYWATKPRLLSYSSTRNGRTFVSSIRKNCAERKVEMIDPNFANFHEIIQGKPVPGQKSAGAIFFFGLILLQISQPYSRIEAPDTTQGGF